VADKVDPFDVEALETSLNDSATRVSALWISFLIFGLYLVIAAGTVTHRQLLLEDPIKLPVLNIELPLVGFFFLAPILFVIFHAYVLLQVLLLGRTAAAYNEAVEHNIKVAADNARVRQRLANTLFAQIFAGSPRERNGWLGFLLKAMAWITLAIAPVLILFVFQFQFLPYHSGAVTWAVRFLIVVDLAIILVLWPAARDPGHEVTLVGVFRQWIALPIAIVTAAFAWIVLSYPGEPHAEWTRYWPDEKSQSKAHKFGDGLQCRTQSPVSLVFRSFDRLNLGRVDAVDDEALKKIEEHTKAAGEPDYQGERTQHLSGRNFNCANFSDYADLRRVDLAEASLRGASFVASKLQGASLDYAQLQGASLDFASFRAHPSEKPNFRALPSFLPSFRAHPSLEPSFRAHPSMPPSFRAHPSFGPSFRAHPSLEPSFRAHPSIGPSFRAHLSLTPSFRAHPSIGPSFRAHLSVTPSFRAHTSIPPSFRAST